MLEMLVNNFFGADVAYEEIRDRYVPALDGLIDHMVSDTVAPHLGRRCGGWPPAADAELASSEGRLRGS